MPMPTFPLARLGGFRSELHACFTRRADALFELGDALLCAHAIPSLPHLSLEPVHRRGWGSVYAALARGRIDTERLRDLLASYLPPADPLVFAVDVTTWPRCDAECSPERGYYYHPSRHSAGQPIIAGWAFQWIAQLSFDRDSWTAPVDAPPAAPVGRHRPAGRSCRSARSWRGCPPAGRCHVCVRRRLRLGPAHPGPGRRPGGGAGAAAIRPLLLRRPATTAHPAARAGRAATAPSSPSPTRPPGRPRPPPWRCQDDQYGTVTVQAWTGLHPKQQRHPGHGTRGPRPIVRGTILRVQVERVPARTRPPKVLWLWWAGPGELRPGPGLAGLCPPVRPGTHHPVLQADPRLDDPTAAPSRPGRPVDLAGPGRLHPAAPGPRGRRPTPDCRGSGLDPSRDCRPTGCAGGFRGCCARSARRPPRRNPPDAPPAGPRAGPPGPRSATRRSRSRPRSPGAGGPGPQGPPDGPSPSSTPADLDRRSAPHPAGLNHKLSSAMARGRRGRKGYAISALPRSPGSSYRFGTSCRSSRLVATSDASSRRSITPTSRPSWVSTTNGWPRSRM